MELPPIDLRTVKTLAEALAIGLLVGIERYKSRRPGEPGFAGVRTFALSSLLGALAGLIGQPLLTFATFTALAALIGVGYYRSSERSLGATTEVAALLVFWLGYLLHEREVLAIATAIVLTILLASKRALHDFVKEKISETELYDTLKFLAVVIVVWPLLPDRALGPYASLNPSRLWLLVILVSSIGYSGYLLARWLGGRRGLRLSALIGGVVSTTATTMSLAQRARESPEHSRDCSVAGVLANSVQMPRLLILVAVLHPPLAVTLLIPFVGMAAAGLLGSGLVARGIRRGRDAAFEIPLRNPYSLTPALKFALFFVAILLLLETAEARLGAGGVLLASALGGAGSASAAALSVAQLGAGGELVTEMAALSVLVAWAANATVKWLIALLHGSRPFALWLGAGFLAMLGAGLLLLRFSGAVLLPAG